MNSTTLDELRRLNLEQQKKDSAAPTIPAAPTPEETVVPETTETTDTGEPAETQRRKSAGAQARTSAPAARSVGRSKKTATASMPEGEFLVRVREHLASKRTHGGGVKASVDLDPDLSLRAKRYCLEHGNIPLRVLFIELLSAFLEEEGY